MEGGRRWGKEGERGMEVEETAGCTVLVLMRCRGGHENATATVDAHVSLSCLPTLSFFLHVCIPHVYVLA